MPRRMESRYTVFSNYTLFYSRLCLNGRWNVARAVQGAEHLLVRGSVAAGESVAR